MSTDNTKKRIFSWKKLHWVIYTHIYGGLIVNALCPHCHCELEKSKEIYKKGEYKYKCIDCDFKITLEKDVDDLAQNFIKVYKAQDFRNVEVINIGNELVKVQRRYEKDDDYWIDAKISKNHKGELQLMVLAGSKKESDKTQLFLEPAHERLAFDQNNKHPREIFVKVEAIFKKSNSKIDGK